MMQNSLPDHPSILITGGTSGLGQELVKVFLEKGYYVTATGRNKVTFEGFENLFCFHKVDFSDLEQTAAVIKEISRIRPPDIVINNAGILSPPELLLTGNGLEYTFQVNFLSHLLADEIILRTNPERHHLKIIAITSMVCRIGDPDLILNNKTDGYRPYKAYSDSKLYMTLMCRYLHQKYIRQDPVLIGFDPGVFSSGIFRMQRKWFRILYRIAAPFMRSPVKVAKKIEEIAERKDLVSGSVYDYRRKPKPVPDPDRLANELFWEGCEDLIKPYL
jgi:NAD(P)-dependent dehydrogenase (short-subunit alcohol dehydrogenase family)